jgi:replication-associated recombination protein RarA
MAFVKLNVKPEQKDKLLQIAEGEGRHIYKMLEIIIEQYEQSRVQNELPVIETKEEIENV